MNLIDSVISFLISNAYAADPAPQQGGGMGSLLFLGVFFVIFYVFLLRPQIKRGKETTKMLESLEKGDEIVTNGGLLGKIKKIDEHFIDLEIAENVRIKVQKNAVTNLMPKGTYSAS